MEVTLQQILDAREQRAARQQALLSRYGHPLVCFTMNIAGPQKNSPLIQAGFELGNRWLQAQLSDLTVVHREQHIADTGCEAFYVVDAPAEAIKQRATQIEDSAPVARLFDMDVLDHPQGKKLDRASLGMPERRCLICDQPAHLCARSRTHPVAQLQEKTTALLQEAISREDWDSIAQAAQQSLLYEVCTTPKPGLVDCRNSGSHTDMNIFTFLSSAAALQPYFAQCARIGGQTRHLEPSRVFPLLRFPGKVAESRMFRATKGVNTHKGAIFSLGILCAAAGRLVPGKRSPEALSELCKAMTQGLIQQDFRETTRENAKTAGEALFCEYSITGVRGLAEAGFPQVLEFGLPVLKQGLAAGLSLNEAGCATLLALLANTTDTNLIHRSSLQRHREISREIAELLKTHPFPSRDQLEALDEAFIAENLSCGGCADLLAITYFLYFLEQENRA